MHTRPLCLKHLSLLDWGGKLVSTREARAPTVGLYGLWAHSSTLFVQLDCEIAAFGRQQRALHVYHGRIDAQYSFARLDVVPELVLRTGHTPEHNELAGGLAQYARIEALLGDCAVLVDERSKGSRNRR